MTTETALARAKVNLALHVVGRRGDGYHLLDLLVVFAELGDRITAAAGQGLRLMVTGPQGGGLAADDDNLCLRAARAMQGPGALITLDKHLPVASGIGGGSADAAATLQVLARLWRAPLPDAAAVLALGADVPVCLAGRPARMEGVGEVISPLPPLPAAWLVLVNPGVAVSTPAVFAALARRDNPGLPASLPKLTTTADLAAFLMMQRNDLEPAAQTLAPPIAAARMALTAQSGCRMARMSGSGATCFGLFDDGLAAAAAAQAIRLAHPGWWVQAAEMAR